MVGGWVRWAWMALLVVGALAATPTQAAESPRDTLRAIVREAPLRIELRGADGRTIATARDLGFQRAGAWRPASRAELRLDPADGLVALGLRAADGRADRVGLTLSLAPDEHVYGFGQRFGTLDQRGRRIETSIVDRVATRDPTGSYVADPFYLSTGGYGLMLRTALPATFDVGRDAADRIRIELPAAELSALLIGGEPKTIIQRRAAVVGRPPRPPDWSLGVWKTTIGGESAVRRQVARLRAAGVPLDAVWLYDAVDKPAYLGWPQRIYPGVATGAYRHLARLTDDLHHQGLRVLGYRNPDLDGGDPRVVPMRLAGQLVAGLAAVLGQRWEIDFSHPDALAGWGAATRRALIDDGFDGWMQDMGEAIPAQAQVHDGRPADEAHNTYAVDYLRASYREGTAAKPDLTFFTRSGYQGGQPYALNGFPGDQTADWDRDWGLPSVLPAVLSAGLSGWPYWGPDIGGYLDARGAVADPKELWLRWVELGAVSPTMRDHLGQRTGRPVDVWTDHQTLDQFRRYARLHTCLGPYLAEQAALAHETGLPIARPMFLEAPRDPAAQGIDDQLMLGDDLVAAPVLRPGVTRRSVWLPLGVWTDVWTGVVAAGPGTVEVAAPIGQLPLFVRHGSSLDDLRPRILRALATGRMPGDARPGFEPCG